MKQVPVRVLRTLAGRFASVLLFTVMQNWLNTRPDDMAAWKRMILSAPQLLTI